MTPEDQKDADFLAIALLLAVCVLVVGLAVCSKP